ncbi:MAG: TetR/AcrR family transcriptional regulator [Candidatus Omnitrophica bacterium]|nr:TetR/AcrR family transcriptional regulator [Candidatus Omnitrophota bacterium]
MRTKNTKKIKTLVERRKNQILDVASLIFSKEGFAKANTDEIAKRANLGKGTIYRYFKNKKELFLSVVDRGLDKLKDSILIEVEKTDDPLKKIENAIKAYLSFFEKNRNLIGILIHEQSSFQKRIAKRYFEHYYGNVKRIKRTFKSGIEQGLIKDMDMDSLISVYASMLNGLIYMWQVEERKYRLQDRVPIVLKIFFTGVIKDKKRRKDYE